MLHLVLKANKRWLVFYNGQNLGTVWRSRKPGKYKWVSSRCENAYATRKEMISDLVEWHNDTVAS